MPSRVGPDFQFRRFAIYQKNIGQPLSEEAVLFGAWIELQGTETVVDLGSGCGILSLVIGQRYPRTSLIAVEVEAMAAKASRRSFTTADWKLQASLIETDWNKFTPEVPVQHVVCNPPFFLNSLPGANRSRAVARHSDAGAIERFFQRFNHWPVRPEYISLLLARSDRLAWMKGALRCGWFRSKEAHVRPLPTKPAHRSMITLSADPLVGIVPEEITLRTLEMHRHTSFERYVSEVYLPE